MSGYVSPRGMFYPADQPYLAYEPGHAVRFIRSQRSWNGQLEIEELYKGSRQWAGWAAARPFPNRVPFLETRPGDNRPPPGYMLPGGPTSAKALMQQATVPPTFPAGDWRIYEGGRYGSPMAPVKDLAPSQRMPGDGGGVSVSGMADAVALGLKKILPELATSIGVQTARSNSQTMHSVPSNLAPPIRKLEFTDCNRTPVIVTDAAFVLISEHLVPVGCICTVNQLEVVAESPAALADTEVQIRVGGNPVPRFNSLDCPDFGMNGLPATVNILAIEQQRVQVWAKSRTVGIDHNIVAMLRGWDTQPSYNTNLDGIAAWRGQ